MSRKFKLGVLRARHDPNTSTVGDQPCRETFLSNGDGTSVCQYWTFHSNDHLDFTGSSLLPWVDITLTWALVDGRKALADTVYQATAAAGSDLSGFDGFVVMLAPGGMVTVPNPRAAEPGQPPTVTQGFNSGTTTLTIGKPVAVLPVTSDHTFFCHEVGHVLGFGHTYGVLNNGVDWDGVAPWAEDWVYGDPYDIMSSAMFGTRRGWWGSSPTFAGTPVASWPGATTFNSMGPAPARAHVHFWDDKAFASNTIEHVQSPAAGQSIPVRLYRASEGSKRKTLLVISPPNEGPDRLRRCFVEYRDASGWDRGLDTAGADLARRAVVAHGVGTTLNDGLRCWYRGRILVPVEVDPDLRILDAQTVVTVTGVAPDFSYVDLRLTATAAHALHVDQYVRDQLVGVVGQQTEKDTPCGRVRYGRYLVQRTSRFEVQTAGYGGIGAPGVTSPVIAWRVGFTPITGIGGTVGVKTNDGRTVDVAITVDPATQTLTLANEPTDGTYRLTVTCTASEPDGSDRLEEQLTYAADGDREGAHPQDRPLLEECMRRIVQRLLLRPRDLLIPPGPPAFAAIDFDRVNRARLERLIQSLAQDDRRTGEDLRLLADLRYGAIGR